MNTPYSFSKIRHCYVALLFLYLNTSSAILYPQESENREVKSLNGIWNFRVDYKDEGMREKWFSHYLIKTGPVIPMPVPSSYNDVTQEKSIREHIGWVWYERQFYVSNSWAQQRVLLHVGSAHYYSMVWVNGHFLVDHTGGHLPFEGDASQLLHYGKVNYVTIAVNNTLSPTTLPPGFLYHYNESEGFPPNFVKQWYQFDFFNYAGIHRSVTLYTTPQDFWIEDITLSTIILEKDAKLLYTIKMSGEFSSIHVTVVDDDDRDVGYSSKMADEITVKNANLWWPYTMNQESVAYRYTLKINVTRTDKLLYNQENNNDIYRLKFGFRTVKVTNTSLLINDKKFYCKGVGMHEDADIRGKGLDDVLVIKNFNLLKWLGANCFRTSHYPYAEEIMDEADKQGIVVIDESPGVGIVKKEFYSHDSLNHHKHVMRELIQRDKNRPSVIIWSIANEPSSQKTYAEPYFKELIDLVHKLDHTRPVTVVMGQGQYWNDRVSQYCDIVCINSYQSWYGSFGGRTEIIVPKVSKILDGWFNRLNKPMIVTEYGAGTIAGFHSNPSKMFTEEYQCDFLGEYHKVFDKYRTQFLVGEMVWNFADFMTDQNSGRVYGNRKGLFTRNRQPKTAAFLIRQRYHYLLKGYNVKNYYSLYVNNLYMK